MSIRFRGQQHPAIGVEIVDSEVFQLSGTTIAGVWGGGGHEGSSSQQTVLLGGEAHGVRIDMSEGALLSDVTITDILDMLRGDEVRF